MAQRHRLLSLLLPFTCLLLALCTATLGILTALSALSYGPHGGAPLAAHTAYGPNQGAAGSPCPAWPWRYQRLIGWLSLTPPAFTGVVLCMMWPPLGAASAGAINIRPRLPKILTTSGPFCDQS